MRLIFPMQQNLQIEVVLACITTNNRCSPFYCHLITVTCFIPLNKHRTDWLSLWRILLLVCCTRKRCWAGVKIQWRWRTKFVISFQINLCQKCTKMYCYFRTETWKIHRGGRRLLPQTDWGLAVAARGFLPTGANVCVAAPSSQIGSKKPSPSLPLEVGPLKSSYRVSGGAL